MNYRFFEELADAEAEHYLATFVEDQRKQIPSEWWDRLVAEGVDAIEPYFAEFVPKINIVEVASPAELPQYIVQSMERDHGGFRDFPAQADRIAVLTAAFYFGEGFQRSFPSLSWAVGQADRAEQGQPVVTGFSSDSDLPVLVVAENLALEYERDPSRVATAVRTWRKTV